MSSEKAKARGGNTIMELLLMACIQDIEESEEGIKAHQAVYEETGFPNSIGDLYHLYAEKMFEMAWKLRGNPELLAKMIEPG